MLDPEWYNDERLANCGVYALPLLLGLMCAADCEGKIEDRPVRIKAMLFPYFDIDLDVELSRLSEAGFIVRYSKDAINTILVVNFNKYQQVYHKEKSLGLPDYDLSLVKAYAKLSDSLPEASRKLPYNYNNNIIYNNITNTNTLTVSEDTTPEVINSPKEVKKEKPELEKLGSHFRATREQIEKLILEDGEAVFKTRVQTINDYCAANGKSYKDYPAAYRNFRKGDAERKANKIPLNESRYERSQRNARELHEKLQRGEPLKQTNIFLMKE